MYPFTYLSSTYPSVHPIHPSIHPPSSPIHPPTHPSIHLVIISTFKHLLYNHVSSIGKLDALTPGPPAYLEHICSGQADVCCLLHHREASSSQRYAFQIQSNEARVYIPIYLPYWTRTLGPLSICPITPNRCQATRKSPYTPEPSEIIQTSQS